jgi:hypothetical protein
VQVCFNPDFLPSFQSDFFFSGISGGEVSAYTGCINGLAFQSTCSVGRNTKTASVPTPVSQALYFKKRTATYNYNPPADNFDTNADFLLPAQKALPFLPEYLEIMPFYPKAFIPQWHYIIDNLDVSA